MGHVFGKLRAWISGYEPRALHGYAICTAPRSGSNLLCQWLTSTDVLGRPLEYFNGPARRALDDPNFPDNRPDQCAWIRSKAKTPNGVYGVKLFSSDSSLIAPDSNTSQSLDVHAYIYLERSDRLGQAISWARALQTQQYRSSQPIQGTIRYDGPTIRDRLEAINAEHARWSDFFDQHNLLPLRLTYEEALEAPQKAVDKVAAFLNLNHRPLIDFDRITLKVQRDVVTSEWRQRYIQEYPEPSIDKRP